MTESDVVLSDLKVVVEELASERLKSYIRQKDATLVARILHTIASTLRETGVRVDPNHHMLRCSEAKALAGYLRSKYKGLAKDAERRRKREGARAYVNVRNDLGMQGVKITEALISASSEIDDDYVKAIENETSHQEIADHFEHLWYVLSDRLEVLIEISRNERAIVKGTQES